MKTSAIIASLFSAGSMAVPTANDKLSKITSALPMAPSTGNVTGNATGTDKRNIEVCVAINNMDWGWTLKPDFCTSFMDTPQYWVDLEVRSGCICAFHNVAPGEWCTEDNLVWIVAGPDTGTSGGASYYTCVNSHLMGGRTSWTSNGD